jgi:hypothetical protein
MNASLSAQRKLRLMQNYENFIRKIANSHKGKKVEKVFPYALLLLQVGGKSFLMPSSTLLNR